MTLKNLQEKFLNALYDPETVDNFLLTIDTTENFSAINRFLVYQDSIIAGLVRALREIYPVCEKLVGEEFFLAMTHPFVKKIPSHSPNLNDYGAQFADFVAQFSPAKCLVYLADVCRLEWCYHTACYSNLYPALNIENLSAVPESMQAAIIFQLPPNSSLLHSLYPIQRIWEMNQDDHPKDVIVDLNEGAVWLFIWPKASEVKIEVLTQHQWKILKAIQDRVPLGEICAAYSADISSELAKMMETGWLVDFEINKSNPDRCV